MRATSIEVIAGSEADTSDFLGNAFGSASPERLQILTGSASSRTLVMPFSCENYSPVEAFTLSKAYPPVPDTPVTLTTHLDQFRQLTGRHGGRRLIFASSGAEQALLAAFHQGNPLPAPGSYSARTLRTAVSERRR